MESSHIITQSPVPLSKVRRPLAIIVPVFRPPPLPTNSPTSWTVVGISALLWLPRICTHSPVLVTVTTEERWVSVCRVDWFRVGLELPVPTAKWKVWLAIAAARF